MAQKVFHESGRDGRSVLGMVSVQVERDPKTGTTVVKSVAPVSPPSGAPVSHAVFDDGRKSIHAVGAAADEPSTEELGQILRAIDGVGMRVLLDEVPAAPEKEEAKGGSVTEAPMGKDAATSVSRDLMSEAGGESGASGNQSGAGGCAEPKEDEEADTTTVVVRDMEGKEVNIQDGNLDGSPVTLLFLGYADATSSQDDCGETVTVERVIISENGEEHVIEPQVNSAPEQREEEVSKKDEDLQDVPLDENEAKAAQGAEAGKESKDSPPPGGKQEGASKQKTCQCCAVM